DNTTLSLHDALPILVSELNERLNDQHMSIDITDDAKKYIAKEAYEPEFGARPLKRFIQREIETPLAHKMIESNLEEGLHVNIDRSEEHTSELQSRFD